MAGSVPVEFRLQRRQPLRRSHVVPAAAIELTGDLAPGSRLAEQRSQRKRPRRCAGKQGGTVDADPAEGMPGLTVGQDPTAVQGEIAVAIVVGVFHEDQVRQPVYRPGQAGNPSTRRH